MQDLAVVGYVIYSHPSAASMKNAYSDVCRWRVEAALPRDWLLETELLLIDGDNKLVKAL